MGSRWSTLKRMLPLMLLWQLSAEPIQAGTPHSLPNPQLWWKGTMDSALVASREQKKPLFIYWGAVWCPPCNEVKKEIFSHEKFPEVMTGFIPVALDGDSDQAQVWGERLGTTGYPTLLVLDENEQIRLRILDAISWVNFEAAMKSLQGTSSSLLATVQKFSQGQPLSDSEWLQLAWSDWEHLEPGQLSNQEPIALALTVIQKLPESMAIERTRIASFILNNAEGAPSELAPAIQSRWDELFALATANSQALQIAELFLTGSVSTLKWSFTPELPASTQRNRVALWATALDNLEKITGDSLTYTAKIFAARCALWQLSPTGEDTKKALLTRLDELSKTILNGKDPYLQKSLLPSLADGYDNLGDQKAAITLLTRGANRSDTPWYFYSHIAWLKSEGGDKDGAVPWAEKAMYAAKGSATKIQWTFTYIKAVSQSALKDRDARMNRAMTSLWELALKNPEGFHNRNKRYMKQAAEIAKVSITGNKPLSSTIQRLRKRCDRLSPTDSAQACTQYFDSILPIAASAPAAQGA